MSNEMYYSQCHACHESTGDLGPRVPCTAAPVESRPHQHQHQLRISQGWVTTIVSTCVVMTRVLGTCQYSKYAQSCDPTCAEYRLQFAVVTNGAATNGDHRSRRQETSSQVTKLPHSFFSHVLFFENEFTTILLEKHISFSLKLCMSRMLTD